MASDRITGRFWLACTAAGLLAAKFVLHLGRFGELGLGFWTAVLLVAALVAVTRRARLARVGGSGGDTGSQGPGRRPEP